MSPHTHTHSRRPKNSKSQERKKSSNLEIKYDSNQALFSKAIPYKKIKKHNIYLLAVKTNQIVSTTSRIQINQFTAITIRIHTAAAIKKSQTSRVIIQWIIHYGLRRISV